MKTGDVVEVADAEGVRLCATRMATPVVDDAVETATAPKHYEARRATREF